MTIMDRWRRRAEELLDRLDTPRPSIARLAPPESVPPMTALPPNAAESIRLAEGQPPLPRLADTPAMDAGQPPSVPRLGPPPCAPLETPATGPAAERATPTPGLPPITELQRLRLHPGDALVVKLGQRLISLHEADQVEQVVRKRLALPPTTRILVIGGQDSISTLAGGD